MQTWLCFTISSDYLTSLWKVLQLVLNIPQKSTYLPISTGEGYSCYFFRKKPLCYLPAETGRRKVSVWNQIL